MYVLAILASMFVFPWMFPSLFWKSEEVAKVLYFNVERSSENPYMENERTSISIYDPDDQSLFQIHDVHDDDSYEGVCSLISARMNKAKANVLYLVTYDVDNKCQCLSLILEEYFEQQQFATRFMDIKMLFYSSHDQIPKINYKDIMEYYRVPQLDCRPLEYTVLFDQIAQDYHIDVNDAKDRAKLKPMFQRTLGKAFAPAIGV